MTEIDAGEGTSVPVPAPNFTAAQREFIESLIATRLASAGTTGSGTTTMPTTTTSSSATGATAGSLGKQLSQMHDPKGR